jgi:hypothetical protein
MTVDQYIDSLSKANLRILTKKFAKWLSEQEMLDYIGDSTIDFCDEDDPPLKPGFINPRTGDRILND